MNEAFSLMLLPWGAVLRKEFVIVAMQRFVVVGARTLWEARRAGGATCWKLWGDTWSSDNSFIHLSHLALGRFYFVLVIITSVHVAF
jgi:hypothetical protein